MGQTEIEIFIILVGVVVLVLVVGTLLFIMQYRNRKIRYESEKKRMEEIHRVELLNSRLFSQQQTMQHIGQEIHDSVAQKLTLASIYIRRMQFEQKDPGNTEGLENTGKVIDDALLELRQLSKDLTDSRLFETELSTLVNEICDMVNSTGTCRATVSTSGVPELVIQQKNSVLRIIQEFVQNSLKHAECKSISLILSGENGKLSVVMQDDGRGFDKELAAAKGMGLHNIRRRAQLMGAVYEIHSQAGKGTRLELTVPIQTQIT